MTATRILITGATGFIGRHLIPRLEHEDRHLTLAVRNGGACPRAWRESERISIVETGNIEAAPSLEAAFSHVSCVVHLAGLTNARDAAGRDTTNPFHDANVAATRALVHAALKHGVETFVHLSSVFAVADNSEQKIIDHATAAEPATAYGKSKRQAEECVTQLAGKGIFAVSLRPPLVVGPDAKGNWAALQRLAASGLPLPFGSIRNRRSLLSVESAVDAIAHLCARQWPPTYSGAYCITDAEPLSTADMVTELRKGMGLPPRLFPCPPSALYAAAFLINERRRASSLLGNCEVDDTRFRRTFEYRQIQDLKEAIRRSGAGALKQVSRQGR
jgi:UDP-glucose 4-epimerase